MNKNEIFTLWIPMGNQKELPLLAHLSLKSMVLCGHDVILYTYCDLENIPEGVEIKDGNEILDKSRIFITQKGHKNYGAFSDLFRFNRLYEYGGTWLDLDVILINNINEKYDGDIIIGSEPIFRYYMHPNLGIMRFPKHDPLIKHMRDYAESAGTDIEFGEIGPRLISNTLKQFPDYNRYLKTFDIYHMHGWQHLNDYSKEPRKYLNKMNMDEIIGFHLNNTFFEKILTTENPDGLFEILKKGILDSESYDEYLNHLKQCKILDFKSYDIVKDWDLKYLDMHNDIHDENYKFTILIDSRNLRKVEIYNIIHSIGFGAEPEDLVKDIQIIIFGKTDIGNDKIRFKDNIIILTSDFKSIYPYIDEYIYGDYVIPINKPVIFCPKFFKDKNIEVDLENYPISNGISVNIFNKKYFKKFLYEYSSENIFNLTNEMFKDLNYITLEEKTILGYDSKSKDINKLIQIIDNLDKLDEEDVSFKFLNAKSKLQEMKFKNLSDEASYHYYSSYLNILSSSSYYEYKLKNRNTQLNCLNSFYLNKLNVKYNF